MLADLTARTATLPNTPISLSPSKTASSVRNCPPPIPRVTATRLKGESSFSWVRIILVATP
ncbi:hypothetical protein [Rivularia sp. UHCC 0363]|uniref:hypothetical protein n=1 Tax=Rivularia sp. UHCC 0363 TaxID=3110244 RepID=UPI002B1EF26A|nr:hypothetical protein [Rivularia sp. UHCC 0363]MEA5593411.1 hypothetical protein [Rivularia sp. UHCC 0363]